MKGLGFYGELSPVIKRDLDVIEDSVTRILLTLPGERVGNVTFGCKLQNFLFDLSALFIEESRADIFSSVTRWEPRVTVDNVTIEVMDVHTAVIKLEMTVKATLETFELEKTLRF